MRPLLTVVAMSCLSICDTNPPQNGENPPNPQSIIGPFGTTVATLVTTLISVSKFSPRKAVMHQYVIERTSETRREWWTGTAWSDDENGAKWYDSEPDASKETDDENAHSVHYETGSVVD